MSRPALLDTTVLSYVAIADAKHLVRALWADEACTTAEALGEYAVGVGTKGLPFGFWDDLPIVTPAEDEVSFAEALPVRGERSRGTMLAINILAG